MLDWPARFDYFCANLVQVHTKETRAGNDAGFFMFGKMIDAVLEILKVNGVLSLAFLSWAWVVWHFGRHIMRELQSIHRRMQDVNFYLSNRLTKIESHLERNGDFRPYRNGDRS